MWCSSPECTAGGKLVVSPPLPVVGSIKAIGFWRLAFSQTNDTRFMFYGGSGGISAINVEAIAYYAFTLGEKLHNKRQMHKPFYVRNVVRVVNVGVTFLFSGERLI